MCARWEQVYAAMAAAHDPVQLLSDYLRDYPDDPVALYHAHRPTVAVA